MYNSYEEYMQSVLGYNLPNTYREAENNYYYDSIRINPNMQEVNSFYPEIYGIVYPVVQKVCSKRNFGSISEEQISQMVDEVYGVVESDEEESSQRENLKNGDVRNPRAKETRRTHRQNYLLKDLIRILIIRELLGRPNFGPGGLPVGPRPNIGGMNQMPPIMRPRKYQTLLKQRGFQHPLRFFC